MSRFSRIMYGFAAAAAVTGSLYTDQCAAAESVNSFLAEPPAQKTPEYLEQGRKNVQSVAMQLKQLLEPLPANKKRMLTPLPKPDFKILPGSNGRSTLIYRCRYIQASPYDVGGNGVRAEAAFLWRLKSSNLWLGPALAIANIPNANFEDLDPEVISGNNQSMINHGYLAYDPEVSTSGQMIDVMAKANYYFNPDHLFSVYLTGNLGYRMLSLNYRGGIESKSIDANTFIASVGLGVETHIDDLMLGLEVQEFFSPYSGELKESDSANTVISAKISWKF